MCVRLVSVTIPTNPTLDMNDILPPCDPPWCKNNGTSHLTTLGLAWNFVHPFLLKVSTIVGGDMGFADGTLETARFHTPTDVAVDGDGKIIVLDYSNFRSAPGI